MSNRNLRPLAHEVVLYWHTVEHPDGAVLLVPFFATVTYVYEGTAVVNLELSDPRGAERQGVPAAFEQVPYRADPEHGAWTHLAIGARV